MAASGGGADRARPVRSRTAWVVGDMEAASAFFVDGLGLPVVTRFADHAGWWGVVVGLPDPRHQLELTWHAAASATAGGPDDLLVLWWPTRDDVLRVRHRVAAAPEVRPENPWWWDRSITVLDPDGHRVTLGWEEPTGS